MTDRPAESPGRSGESRCGTTGESSRLDDASLSPVGAGSDDRIEAMGRVERRRLLLRLSTVGPGENSSVDFGGVATESNGMDPLVAMRHLHLPVLEEKGFVRWDRETDRVTRGPRFAELEPLLRLYRTVVTDLRRSD